LLKLGLLHHCVEVFLQMSWNVADHLLDVVNVVVVAAAVAYLLRMDIRLLQMWVTVVQYCTSNSLPNWPQEHGEQSLYGLVSQTDM